MIESHWDEEVCRRWDVLADENHTYYLLEKEYFYYKNKWWLHLNKSGSDTLPLRKTFWFQASVVYLRTFTPRSWRRAIRSHSFLEEQTMAVGIEFVLYMAGMARLQVVFFIQKVKEEASKVLGKNGETRCWQQRWLSRNHLFCDR